MNKKIVFLLFFAVFSLSWADTCTCTDCATCTDALNNGSCDIVQLTADISNQPFTCIDNPENFTNKTFDCQGHTIDGTYNGYGIYLEEKSNISIINCSVREFEYGFYLHLSNYSNLSNNTIHDNFHVGIVLHSSLYINVLDNYIYNNRWGISLDGANYNNITNNFIYTNTGSWYSSGIYIYPGSNNTILNNTLYSNVNGLYVMSSSSNGNIIDSNKVYDNTYGFVLNTASYNNLYHNTAYNNLQDGYLFLDSDNNTMFNNTAYNNSQWDINITNSPDNVFINQTLAGDSLTTYPTVISFTYTGDVLLRGVSTPPEDPANYINITKYVNATGTGTLFINFSYSDADLGDISEPSLRVSRNNGTWETDPSVFATTYGVDTTNNIVYADINNFGSVFAPLGQEALCTCTDCATCTDALNNDSCDIVQLTADISNQPSTCIDNPENFTNKTFDCQGHTIDGTYNGYGIYLSSKPNNTIKNCLIREFARGIYFEAESNNTNILNNTVIQCSQGGIFVASSFYNTIMYNNASDNSGSSGIYVFGSNNNLIANNTANSNWRGIHLDSSSNNNLIENNTANSNSDCGVLITDSSSYNIINSNSFVSNWNAIGSAGSPYNNITNNFMWSSTNNGIDVNQGDGFIVLNNNVSSNVQNGIMLQGTYAVVANNTLNSNRYGIHLLSGGSDVVVENNTVYDNTEYGIYLESVSQCNLSNNIAYNNQQWDINITNSPDNVFINQTIAGDSLTTYPTVISFTYTGDVSLKGVSTPPEDPANYINITKYVNATGTGTLFLNFSYSDADLGSIAEASLRVSRNNGAWETDPSVFATTYGVDTTNNIVYANINNF
ncbi:MAG: right-handed parallel beta-helix repeat-containing protein, partial [Candidatus Anstonellales archaeon]